MRLIARLFLGVFLTTALAVGGARWVGRAIQPDTFPLPEANGCWQELCMLLLSGDDIVTALAAHPDVKADSPRLLTLEPGSQVISFMYKGAHGVQPVMLSVGSRWYDLSFPVQLEDPVLQLSDVVAALGVPDRITLTPALVQLHYPERGLEISVKPAERHWRYLLLGPYDPVTNLTVAPRQSYRPVYGMGTQSWAGFGVYTLHSRY